MHKNMVVALLAVSSLSCWADACPDEATAPQPIPPSPPVASILLSPANPSLVVGASENMTATCRNAAAATMTCPSSPIWTSSAAGIATVSGAGVVTANAPGTATIAASSGGASGQTTVTVSAPPATLATIVLTPATHSLPVNGSVNLTATCRTAAGTDLACPSAPNWTSLAPGVASVSGGVVTAIAPGTATITATIGSVSGLATVTVTPPTPAFCDVGAALHDEFDDAMASSRWTSIYYDPFTGGHVDTTVTHSTSGGNPGGFRRMTHTLGFPPDPVSNLSSIWVAHFYTAGSYKPNTEGAIARLVYQEDQRIFTSVLVSWAFAVRQNGQIFVARPAGATPITDMTWGSVGPYNITPASFGNSRPDFTAAGGQIEFGFLRHNSTELNPGPTSNYTTDHGIDNWRVWVCKGTPPIEPVAVFEDDFNFSPDPSVRWDTTYTRTGGASTPVLANPLSGGNPGGYRQGRHEFPGAGFVTVTHLFKTPFDPAPVGPITRLDVSMDRLMEPASTLGSGVGSAFVVSQGGVTYTASLEANNVFSNTTWQRVTKSLTAADFLPAPGPNFSAGVMRFGMIRGNTSGAGVTVIWGTDNWRVEVWR